MYMRFYSFQFCKYWNVLKWHKKGHFAPNFWSFSNHAQGSAIYCAHHPPHAQQTPILYAHPIHLKHPANIGKF